jgi:hypothetical protein
MEATFINGYKISQHRKNIAKFVIRMKDRACHLLSQGNNLEEVDRVLSLYMKEIEYHGSIYISYMPVNNWNDRERLFIRNSAGDYTLVSIYPDKDEE